MAKIAKAPWTGRGRQKTKKWMSMSPAVGADAQQEVSVIDHSLYLNVERLD